MPKVILSQKEERRSFIIALAYLSDFILFAKSHLIAEGRRKKEEGRGKKFYGLSSVFI
ncbi:MAG: hypothetical protein F6K23_15230 [Okeania sp. SIO2C9]|nr:hypothetical protein [Okeania sp. SIO2C9]